MSRQYGEMDESEWRHAESMTESEDSCSGANILQRHGSLNRNRQRGARVRDRFVASAVGPIIYGSKREPNPSSNSPNESELAIRKKLVLRNSCVWGLISTSSIRLSLMRITKAIFGAGARLYGHGATRGDLCIADTASTQAGSSRQSIAVGCRKLSEMGCWYQW